MNKRKFRIIPFDLLNFFKGLSGKEKEKARAKYYYSGETLDRMLIDIEYSDDVTAKLLANIDYELKIGNITEREHEKRSMTVKGEPWVHTELHVNDADGEPTSGEFDVDWNEYWIKHLVDHGYRGSSEEEIINSWLVSIHRTILLQEEYENENGSDELVKRTQHKDGRADYK